jgi:hypothetical protein
MRILINRARAAQLPQESVFFVCIYIYKELKIMYKTLLGLWVVIAFIASSCGGSKSGNDTFVLISGEFNSVQVDADIHSSEEPVINFSDTTTIKGIIDKVNRSKREDAKSMVFEEGPDGLLTFNSSDSPDSRITVPYFTETGDVLYEDYFIDANLNELDSLKR